MILCYILHQFARGTESEIHAHPHGECVNRMIQKKRFWALVSAKNRNQSLTLRSTWFNRLMYRTYLCYVLLRYPSARMHISFLSSFVFTLDTNESLRVNTPYELTVPSEWKILNLVFQNSNNNKIFGCCQLIELTRSLS